MRLLRSKHMIRHACDVSRNPAFWHADARTRDAHGRTVADAVGFGAYRDVWPGRLAELVKLDPREVEDSLVLEPVRLAPIRRPGRSPRIVGVPTFFRRCYSNLIQGVLERAVDHVLPSSVRGYRPGRPEAVRAAILDVADGVRKGRIRHWAKLDFSSYFTAMPWQGIEEALRHYRCDDELIGYVMAGVRCPLVTRDRQGNLHPVRSDRGAQMGLAESSTLANMLPWELDEHFAAIAPRVHYDRYSDDIFVGSAIRSEVVGGVRTVIRWARRHGITIKGVSPDQRPESLVHDVRNRKIEYLGAEIDQQGNVHMPIDKLKEKVREIERRHSCLAVDDVVEGVSRHGDGGGVEVFDDDDVDDLVEGFLSYWENLDPRGHAKAKALIDKSFPLARSPRSGGPGKVWAAKLWAAQADAGAKTMDPCIQPSPSGHTADPTTTHGPPPAADGSSTGTSTMGNASLMGTCRPTNPEGDEPGDHGDAGPTTTHRDELRSAVADEDPMEGHGVSGSQFLPDEDGMLVPTPDEDDPPLESDGRKSLRFPSTSLPDDPDEFWKLEELIKESLKDQGACGDPLPGESSTGAVFENSMLVFDAQGASDRGDAVVGMIPLVDGEPVGKPRTWLAHRSRPEAAILRAMLDEVRRTSPGGSITLGMTRSDLVKTLLQPHRRFRAPLHYSLIVRLHDLARTTGVAVTVVGGVTAPGVLRTAVERVAALTSGKGLAPTPRG
jgi:hypothetical protein